LITALICGAVILIILFEGEDRLPGPCSTGFNWGNRGGSGETKELLENRNFEATPAAVRDLEAGIVDERLVSILQTVTEEYRVCVTAFKEGHYFMPGIPDGPLIPDGYGEAGVLFSGYTRSGTEVPHRAERGGPQGRAVTRVETSLLGYFSKVASLVQPGQNLEGFRLCTA
jgi:hypothetical protein